MDLDISMSDLAAKHLDIMHLTIKNINISFRQLKFLLTHKKVELL